MVPAFTWSLSALLRFHARVGVRLTLRYFALFVPIGVIWIGISDEPTNAIRAIGLPLFSGNPPSAGYWWAVALLCVAINSWAVPRITHSITGWHQHLPVHHEINRRGILLSLTVVQLPVVITLLVIASFVTGSVSFAWPEIILRIAVILLGSPILLLPVKNRKWVHPASFVFLLAGCSGPWFRSLFSLSGLILLDCFSGALVSPRRDRKKLESRISWLELVLSFRAVGWSSFSAVLISCLPLAAVFLFLANNTLPQRIAVAAVQASGIVALGFLYHGLARRLTLLRPAWPWFRSLPASSARRIFTDFVFLSLHSSVVLILAALLRVQSLAPILVLAPLLALVAAGSMRNNEKSAGAETVFIAFSAAALTALLPWTTLLFLAAIPFAYVRARRTDARQKVSRWLEFQHMTAGDTISWSR